MAQSATTALESDEFSLPAATNLNAYVDARTHEAREGEMTAVAHVEDGVATGHYTVDHDGETFVVDMENGACTCSCPGLCEHRRFAALGISYGSLAAPGETLKTMEEPQ